jgi:predicted nucleic acid-binding Zn ribbon protein
MTQLLDDLYHKCLFCGKEIGRYQIYCSSPHCQQKYERKLAIVHNSIEYKIYIRLFYIAEEEAYLRGDS